MKKFILNVFLVNIILVSLLLSGCTKDNDKQNIEKESNTTTEKEQLQRVGVENIGYISIPSTWVKFEEIEGGDDIQYSDPSGISIITMNIFSTEGLDGENAEKFNAELASKNVWINIENAQDPESINGAKVKLNNRDAYQVYASYDDDSMLVTWCLEDDDGVIHYVAAEGTNETIADVVSYVEESYSFEK